ncbi:TrbL/VirB6 family protein [Anaplasma ovis]|uniref:type IV secretion system protein n=1 Tax=Anaplasma ovis TaxID=142058 RepID=UPI000A885A45|nr:type IV secretion system protein [Anaplasma ovis]
MLRIIPVVFLMLLSGCGYHGCMSQQDAMNDTVRSVVYANPKQRSDGLQGPWVKVDFPVKDKDIKLEIEHYNVDFCHDAELPEVKLEAFPGDMLTPGKKKEFTVRFPVNIMPEDKIRFSLVPIRSFTVDDAICRNQDDDVYAADSEECRKRDIGQQRVINFSHKLVDKHGFMNSWYEVPQDTMLSPFVAGFPPHIIPGKSDEESLKKGFDSTQNMDDQKYLCYSDYDIEKEAKGTRSNAAAVGTLHSTPRGIKNCVVKCQPFGRYGYRPGSRELPTGCYKACMDYSKQEATGSTGASTSTTNTDDTKLNEVLTKVHDARARYVRAMDELAANEYCGVLKTVRSSAIADKEGGKGVPEKKYHAYHLLSYDKGNGVLATVLPFVSGPKYVYSTYTFQPVSVRKSGDSSIFASSSQRSESGEDPNLRVTLPTRDDAVKAGFSDIDKYLELDRDYEISTRLGYGVGTLVLTLQYPQQNGTSSGTQHGNKILVGSYKLKVKKDCGAHLQNSLYYTFSEGYPEYSPGAADNKSHKLDFMNESEIQISKAQNTRGDLYYGVRDNGDGTSNNVGHFEIKATIAKTPPKFFSHIVKWTEDRVRSALYGNKDGGKESVVAGMYRHISTDGPFIRLVNALLILYVMISALYFFLGFSRASIFQLFIIFAKIIIVVYVIRPDSWTFFNDHLFKLFTDGPKSFIAIMTGGVGNSDDFGFMDGILYRFSVSQTWIQLLALIFSGPVGWLTVVLIFWGLFLLVECMFSAVVIYLISIMLIALLLCIAPFFLICVLFKRTKAIFDAWIKVLLQTAMQPVLIFSCIALMVQIVNSVIYAMLNFQVCEACVLSLDLKIATLCVLRFLLPMGIVPIMPVSDVVRELYNTGDTILIGIPGPLFNVLIFVAVAHATRDFVISSGEMCSIMFGAFTNLSDVGGNAAQALLSIVGMDRMTGHMAAQQRHQSSLFYRGAGAGREESFASRLMPTSQGVQPGAGAPTKRKQIIHPADPPASF